MKKIFMFLMLSLYSWCLWAKPLFKIEDYQRLYLPVFTQDGELNVAIRYFKRDGVPSFLIVNLNTLETQVLPVTDVYSKRLKGQLGILHQQIYTSHYYQLFYQQMTHKNAWENQGITHAASGIKANILTVDMCPSSHPFEQAFFLQLAKTKLAFPVAISISGMWILKHLSEFGQLLDLQSQNRLKITWVNHSFTHIYYSDLPNKKNFLLSEMVNLDTEIMLTEQILLEYGQTPSVFFRFPGLVSNPPLLKKLKKYGLIPLGADAWIAKDEPIKPGSIVLVHGNGNEHIGIQRLTLDLNRHEWVDLSHHI